MASGFFVFWLVSNNESGKAEKIEAFFDNMRRKSDAKQPGKDGKSHLPPETGDDLLLLDLPGWDISRAGQVSSALQGKILSGFCLAG
jgi:hypothetical protein